MEGDAAATGASIRAARPSWYVRGATHAASGRTEVTCFRGDEHPDGATVAASADRGDAQVLWRCTTDAEGRPVVRLGAHPRGLAGVWFVLVEEDDERLDLVAFEGPDVEPGTVISAERFEHLTVANEEQLGAIRWSRRTATIDQVYVLAARRRQGIGTLLVYAASAVHQSSGWPGALHADGRRTLLGDRLIGGLPHPDRVAPLTHRAAPMDGPAGG
jgi:GNAT superfamily N-acetyltransferase